MKKIDLSQDLVTKTKKALADIEKEVFGEERGLGVKTGVRAGDSCPPGSCPQPLYGAPPI